MSIKKEENFSGWPTVRVHICKNSERYILLDVIILCKCTSSAYPVDEEKRRKKKVS